MVISKIGIRPPTPLMIVLARPYPSQELCTNMCMPKKTEAQFLREKRDQAKHGEQRPVDVGRLSLDLLNAPTPRRVKAWARAECTLPLSHRRPHTHRTPHDILPILSPHLRRLGRLLPKDFCGGDELYGVVVSAGTDE